MAVLTMIVTQAGLDAITDADGQGLLPLEITEIAIGDAHWTPDDTATALQSEIKRLPVTGGSVIADNFLSVKAIDDSADVYAVGEIGLYAGSVLMAIYSQGTDIAAKATASSSLFQIDAEFTSAPHGTVTVGDIGFDNPQATTEALGVTELATQPEMNAETDEQRVPAVNVVATYVVTKLSELVDSAPATLNTLNKLAVALDGKSNTNHHHDSRYLKLSDAPRGVYVNVSGTGSTASAYTARTWALQIYPSSGFNHNDHLVIRRRHSGSTWNGNSTSNWTHYYNDTFVLSTGGWQLVASTRV